MGVKFDRQPIWLRTEKEPLMLKRWCWYARCAALAVIVGLLGSPVAAQVDPDNEQELVEILQAAKEHAYVHVQVGLRLPVISDRRGAPPVVSESTLRAMVEQMLEGVGDGALRSTLWIGRLGQVSLYANEEAIRRLAAKPTIRRIMAATDRGELYDPDDALSVIEERLRKASEVLVDVYPKSRGRVWELGPRGQSVFSQSGKNSPDFAAEKAAFARSLDAHSIRGNQHSAAHHPTKASEPHVRLNLTYEGLLELRSRTDVLSVRLADAELEDRAPELDPQALNEAQASGAATILLHLKRPPGFDPRSNELSDDAKSGKERSLRKAFLAILEGSSHLHLNHPDQMPGSASLVVTLTYNELKKIYDRPDPRIKSIKINGIAGELSLNESAGSAMAGGINALLIQNVYGFKGNGQYIAVLDSGVRKSHPFFNGRPFQEGCFGSTNSTHVGMCPGADILGDSRPLTPLSAAACGQAAYPEPEFPASNDCAHGTHVAGIALGRSGSFGLMGIAPNAGLVAINVMSRSRSTGRLAAFDSDVIKALELVKSLRVNQLQPITVNMSFGSAVTFGGFDLAPV